MGIVTTLTVSFFALLETFGNLVVVIDFLGDNAASRVRILPSDSCTAPKLPEDPTEERPYYVSSACWDIYAGNYHCGTSREWEFVSVFDDVYDGISDVDVRGPLECKEGGGIVEYDAPWMNHKVKDPQKAETLYANRTFSWQFAINSEVPAKECKFIPDSPFHRVTNASQDTAHRLKCSPLWVTVGLVLMIPALFLEEVIGCFAFRREYGEWSCLMPYATTSITGHIAQLVTWLKGGRWIMMDDLPALKQHRVGITGKAFVNLWTSASSGLAVFVVLDAFGNTAGALAFAIFLVVVTVLGTLNAFVELLRVLWALKRGRLLSIPDLQYSGVSQDEGFGSEGDELPTTDDAERNIQHERTALYPVKFATRDD
eukprot:Clim_evm27s198 gene=Clim_evmTU27s198